MTRKEIEAKLATLEHKLAEAAVREVKP